MDRYSYFSLGLFQGRACGGGELRTEIKREGEGVVCPRALFERNLHSTQKMKFIRLFEPFDVDYHWY